MAIQDSILKFRGSIEGLTFVRTADGYFVRKKKKPVTRKQLYTEPRYKPTLNSTKDFRTATQASGLLRNAITGVLKSCSDKRLSGKLTAAFMNILKTDTINPPGERKVGNADISALKNFQFNHATRFESVVGVPCAVKTDFSSGQLVMNIPPFSKDELLYANGISHFIIHSIALYINFENRTVEQSTFQSNPMMTSKAAPEGIEIVHDIPANANDCMILFAGIRFYEETSDQLYLHYDLRYNTVQVMWARNLGV